MKVFITGGTGFIGSRLALSCASAGHQVAVLGQENTAAEVANRTLLDSKGIQILLRSVNEPDICHQLRGIDIVFHLAATQHEMNVPDQRFWEVNVKGTKNMLNAAAKAGVRQFVHGSTIGVYGAALDGNSMRPPRPNLTISMESQSSKGRRPSFRSAINFPSR